MSEIVAAMATCHAPQLLSRPPDEKPEQLDASIAAMRELGKILDQTRPDALIFLGSDHLETFSQTCVPTFALIAGAEAEAEFAGHHYKRRIHRELANHLLDGLVRSDFDIAYSEDALLGHTFAVPFEYLLEDRDIPIVPFHTNVYMPPLPSTRRCAALGEKIVELLGPRAERVAILASGGMSHYPGTSKYPDPDFDFDWWLIGELEKGNTRALLDLTVEQLDETGNTELLSWCTLLGAIGPQPGELLQYTPTWHHGHGMMRFLPARPRTLNKEAQGRPPYQFRNQGFEFYVHPPEQAFKLNKLLFQVRTDAKMRNRLIDDIEDVASEWKLNAGERTAVQALIDVKNAGTVSDYAAPLVKEGVHPLQALMSLHVIFGDHRRRMKAAERN
jgi:protocatechuate 4,5-dioxygenase beta chain/2,3-dihydroxyphenylpropionate 1,2-dioxygenase